MFLPIVSLVVMMGARAASPPQQAPAATPVQRPAPAQRKIYNETADARAQIATALKAAAEDDMRVLVNFGANGDENCANFVVAMYGSGANETDKQLRLKLGNEYRVVAVDVGHGDRNQDVARAYDVDLGSTPLPHLVILDKTGKVLARSAARDFAADANDKAAFDSKKVLAFLEKYQVAALDAQPLVAAALKKAKAENKEVFLWFSAPW